MFEVATDEPGSGRSLKGAAATAIRILQKRFAELDATTLHLVEALSLEQLEALTDALLDFQQVEDLHAWLHEHTVQH